MTFKMKVIDLSNYDYDIDINHPDIWVPGFKVAGIEGVIIGSQWMGKARWQLQKCKDGNIPVIATYAEPRVDNACQLAREAGVDTVCIVIEPGGIQSVGELRFSISFVESAGMKPVLYGNKGDLDALNIPSQFGSYPLWLASYFANGAILDHVSWWPGPFWGHQFTSTQVIAGRNRDVSEVYLATGEDKLTDDEKLAIFAGKEENVDGVLKTREERLKLADARIKEAADGLAPSVRELAASASTVSQGADRFARRHGHPGTAILTIGTPVEI